MSDDDLDDTQRSARRVRADDDTQVGSRASGLDSDFTQIAAPRVLHSAPPLPEADGSGQSPAELAREHYSIRPVPPQLVLKPAAPVEDVEIPAVDVEAAQARVRRARLLGVIALVATMIAVVLVAGVGLALLL